METRKLSQRQEAPASHSREPSNLSLYDVALGPLKQTDKPGSVLPVFLIYKVGEIEIFYWTVARTRRNNGFKQQYIVAIGKWEIPSCLSSSVPHLAWLVCPHTRVCTQGAWLDWEPLPFRPPHSYQSSPPGTLLPASPGPGMFSWNLCLLKSYSFSSLIPAPTQHHTNPLSSSGFPSRDSS